MEDAHRQPGALPVDDAAPDTSADSPPSPPDDLADINTFDEEEVDRDESLLDEVGALIDDGRTYAQAEIAFQKTRAKLTGRLLGVSLAYVAVALILLHIAFLALAVGLVIALAPLVTIWGAIGIVVGGMLLLVALLCWLAYKRAAKLGDIFSDGDEA
ncbi:MAG: hypothetical protein CL955_01650 [Erythrobacteraceae bacterium]|nr:hypothetical protein [Erythrobacteraceae bacterium]